MAKARPKLDRRGANARVAKSLLDDQGMWAELRPNAEQIRVLKLIGSGTYVRNAQATLAAIRMQLEWSTPKPVQRVEHDGRMTITWVSQAPAELDAELVGRG